MKKINPDFLQAVKTGTNGSPYFTLLSMKIIDFEIGSSHLEIETVPNKHLQPFGAVHGGVFASIIDAAAFWAVYPEADEDVGMTTVDLKVNYLAPSFGGKLIARGHCIKLGKTLGLGEVEVTNGTGKTLAHGTSTLIVLPGVSFVHHDSLPPKFIDVD